MPPLDRFLPVFTPDPLVTAARSSVRTAHPVCICTHLFHHSWPYQMSFAPSVTARCGPVANQHRRTQRLDSGAGGA